MQRRDEPRRSGHWRLRAGLLSLFLALALGPAVLVSPASAAPKCDGEEVTVEGTDGDDSLVGTERDDVIDGGLGNDLLEGLAGEDSICGGEGNDLLMGGDDVDRVFGQAGVDEVHGGLGNDLLSGGAGDDRAQDGLTNAALTTGGGGKGSTLPLTGSNLLDVVLLGLALLAAGMLVAAGLRARTRLSRRAA